MAEVIYSKELNNEFLNKLKEQLKENFKDCKRIAVKLHFGEPGNQSSFKPEQVEPIINILKELDIDFFMFDTSVKYNSPRNNPETHKKVAIDKGWDRLGEINVDDSEFIEEQGTILNYQVAKPLTEADAVLILTHFKGHICSGFGGAIKNLGMGALTAKTKGLIHDGSKPIYNGGCIQCKNCENVCPANAIKVTDHPEVSDCYGCSLCIEVCPQGCFEPRTAMFDDMLAEGAASAQKHFKNFYYVSIAKNIAQRCDCARDPGDIIAKDLGYFASRDAVAIDKACYDKTCEIEGKDPFQEHNNKSGLQQVKAAEKFGMGSAEYNIQIL